MDQRRNPYFILGIDHGEGPVAASAAFATAVRRARRGEHPYSIEDLTWALHRIEHQSEDAASDLDTFRVPADPSAYLTHPDNLQPVPREMGEVISRDEAVAIVGSQATDRAVREALLEASDDLLATGVVEQASAQQRSRPSFEPRRKPPGPPPPARVPPPPPARAQPPREVPRPGPQPVANGEPARSAPTAIRPSIPTVAAVALLLLVAGAGLWATIGDGIHFSGDESTPARSAASEGDDEGHEEVSGSRLAFDDLVPWQRVPHQDSVFGGVGTQSMVSVAVGGPGLVAVGQDGEVSAAAVWTSVQGTEWDRVTHAEEVFGGDGQQAMMGVTAGGPGLVAVGRDAGSNSAAVWTSTDGQQWDPVLQQTEELGGPGIQRMAAVTSVGPGLIAVGRDRNVAAVWRSEDGLEWHRVTHDEEAFGGSGRLDMTAVAEGGPGLVAVGRDEGREAAAVWVSENGFGWNRVEHDESVFGGPGIQSMEAVIAGGPGLVAVGHNAEGAAAWTSADGLVWERAQLRDPAGEPTDRLWMQSVAADGSGFLAVGRDEGRDSAAAWVSNDGLVWDRATPFRVVLGGPRGKSMEAVTAGGPGLVAVGRDGKNNSAAVWYQGDVADQEPAPPEDMILEIDLDTLHPKQLVTPEVGCLDLRDGDLWRDVSGEAEHYAPHAWEFREDPLDRPPDAIHLAHHISYLALADLTGNGRQEVVVNAWCTTGAGGSPSQTVVFTPGRNGPELLDVLHAGISGAVYGDALQDVTVLDGRVQALHGVYDHDMTAGTVSAVPVLFSWDEASSSFLSEEREDPRLVDLQSFWNLRLAPGWPGAPASDVRGVAPSSNADMVDVLEHYVWELDVGDYWAAHDLLAPELVSRQGWDFDSYEGFWRGHLVGAAVLDVVEVDGAAQTVTAQIDFYVVDNDVSRELIWMEFRRTNAGELLISDYEVLRSEWRSNAW